MSRIHVRARDGTALQPSTGPLWREGAGHPHLGGMGSQALSQDRDNGRDEQGLGEVLIKKGRNDDGKQ